MNIGRKLPVCQRMLIVYMRTANDIRWGQIQTVFIGTILQFRSAWIGTFGTDALLILMTENLLINLAAFPVTSMKCECITVQLSQRIGIALQSTIFSDTNQKRRFAEAWAAINNKAAVLLPLLQGKLRSACFPWLWHWSRMDNVISILGEWVLKNCWSNSLLTLSYKLKSGLPTWNFSTGRTHSMDSSITLFRALWMSILTKRRFWW